MKRTMREAGENAYACLSEAQGALFGYPVPPRVHQALERAMDHVRRLNQRATREAKRKAAA